MDQMSQRPANVSFDAFTPGPVAQRIEVAGVGKSRLSIVQIFVLAAIAGVFIGVAVLF